MTLDVANNVARQALLASQMQLALSGRNVAAAGDPARSRVSAELVTTVDGGVRIQSIRRGEDAAIYQRMIAATAATAERDAALMHLETLSQSVGDPELGTAIGAMIGDLQTALADYANSPDDPLFGRTVIERARDVTDKLNAAASQMLLLREEADDAIHASVTEVNRLLAEYHEVNTQIVIGTNLGHDITMDLDRRDGIVAELSAHIGVTTIARDDNDQALFTDGGISLYDDGAREVRFERTAVYTASTVGGYIFVDDMPITGADAPMPSTTGSIVGHAYIRDEVVPAFELQMDEIARELTAIFDDGLGSLFVHGGGPDYAGTIAIAPDVDPLQGGVVENLRDGTGNPSGYAAYADRLLALGEALETVATFDPASELSQEATILDFAAESAGWVERLRQGVDIDATAQAAILLQTSDALSRETGVNLDDEYARQLVIERSFQASSRLIGIIDEMFDTLLGIV
ncbi:MAG: flagellar hook-associated protein FlgK [Acuticoccus sp.]